MSRPKYDKKTRRLIVDTSRRPSPAQVERMSELAARAVWAQIKRMAGES